MRTTPRPTAEAAPPRLLKRCADRLIDALLTRGEAAGEAASDVEEVRALVGAIDAIREGRDPALVRGALSSRTRRPGLLAAFRRILLAEGLGGGGDPGLHREVLEILSAIEQLRMVMDSAAHDSATLVPFMEEPDAYQLLREVAHDIRSPLTSILFLAEALRGGLSGGVNEVQHSQLGLIYSAALGLQTIVSDVVDLSRSGADLDEPPAPLSIRSIFGNVRDLVQPMAEEKGIEVRLRPPRRDYYRGKSLLLSRVLLNLTSNALHFTDEGHVELTARAVAPARLRFCVMDTGRGIAEDRRDTLFEPFQQSGRRPGFFFSGSGLGLSIARRMLRRMDSDLEYQTEVGQGTQFFFDLHMPSVRTV